MAAIGFVLNLREISDGVGTTARGATDIAERVTELDSLVRQTTAV